LSKGAENPEAQAKKKEAKAMLETQAHTTEATKELV